MRAVLVLCAIAGAARADQAADLAAITSAAASCDAARAHCFGIRLHVAEADGALVATPAWVAAELAGANLLFTPLDVGFQIVAIDTRSNPHVRSRRDRDALGALIDGTVIDVFLTSQLDDVDTDGKIAHGVTWRHGDRKFVIVASDAKSFVLAHELGHFFGLPHSTYAISIMNKTPRTAPPIEQRRFADEELPIMKRGLARLVRAKLLADLPR